MGRCRHENADHLMPGQVVSPYGKCLPFHLALVEQLRCLDCGAWLSLGPANDEPAEVQVEIRAATLADVMEREKLSSYFLQGNEFDGWSAHRHGTDFYSGEPIQNRRHWDAGYLARCIVTHDDKEAP